MIKLRIYYELNLLEDSNLNIVLYFDNGLK